MGTWHLVHYDGANQLATLVFLECFPQAIQIKVMMIVLLVIMASLLVDLYNIEYSLPPPTTLLHL
jgi:hypothetical protein